LNKVDDDDYDDDKILTGVGSGWNGRIFLSMDDHNRVFFFVTDILVKPWKMY